jgi:glycosyltransferase involved in cell wall biosynthesis
MKITFLSAAPDLSGGSKVIAIHARLLREAGHDVRVVARRPPVPSVRHRVRSLVRRTPLHRPVRPEDSHFALQGVPLDLHEGPTRIEHVPDADVLVATWWETAEWIRDFPARKGAKAYFVQGWERYVEGMPGERVDATLRLHYRKVTISRFLVDVIERVGGDKDVALVPNALDPGQFDAPPRGRAQSPTVGFVYSHSHWKGCDVVLDAITAMRARRPELRVIAFGTEAPTDPALLAGIEFELRPAQSRIPELYRSTDVWLSGSRLEGFGLPALEAMGCRTPLVSTRYGAPIDLICDGENGFLVDQENATAMAERALAVLDATPEAWAKMSEAAHRSAHGWTWADASKAMEAALAGARR